MRLRPYQTSAVQQTRAALSRSRSVVLCLQVGGGKTVIACEMIRLALARGRRCIFMVHRVELVEQAVDRLGRFGIDAGVIKAGYKPDHGLPVQVACIPSLVRRKQWPEAQFVIFDECHHIASASWTRVADHYKETGAWIVGITATPQRLDGKGLGSVFDEIVNPVTTQELIADGFLLEPVVYAPPSADLAGVRKQGGDYALPELATRMAGLTGSITEYWDKYGRGRRTLCFAVNIEHSIAIHDALTKIGARSMHVDGKSSKDTRALANIGLREGLVDVVTQCALWVEGIDIPALDVLIVARPTMSLGLHRQMIGRVMRPHPGKQAPLVLDHAGNTERHGMITDEIEWSLEDRPKNAAAAPVRTCANCYAVVPPFVTECPQCGESLASDDIATDPGVDNQGELVRVVMGTRKASRDERADVYRGMVLDANQLGYKLGYARRRHKQLFGSWPRFRDMERELYECNKHEPESTQYGVRCARCYEVIT